ncbi:hypothetical protein HUG10_20760 (plasmid) [Halorarum halophilum]|uniref:Uncharacterized protein n=1 Tax=Halorarum halophilum TaxID=2743090 RepID=A0A7D5KAR2_9EURY|nr:hypothetical protein [Halobaculum halophilum]QLG30039.1 hypothetical protein HUG10_20760 [Halobaculum halophilum]
MSVVTYKNAGFKERVEELCEAIAEDPQRSVYVKPRTMKKAMREDFPEMTDGQLGNNIGRVLRELDYAERWGGETYMLLVDRM